MRDNTTEIVTSSVNASTVMSHKIRNVLICLKGVCVMPRKACRLSSRKMFLVGKWECHSEKIMHNSLISHTLMHKITICLGGEMFGGKLALR